MRIQHLSGCCGVREITSLSLDANPQESIKSFGLQCYEKHLKGEKKSKFGEDIRLDQENFRYALFSQATIPGSNPASVYGEHFAVYILDNALGEIIQTGSHTNPNSGNMLKIWIWTIDHAAVKEHLATIEYSKDSQKGIEEPAKPTSSIFGAPPIPPCARPQPPIAMNIEPPRGAAEPIGRRPRRVA